MSIFKHPGSFSASNFTELMVNWCCLFCGCKHQQCLVTELLKGNLDCKYLVEDMKKFFIPRSIVLCFSAATPFNAFLVFVLKSISTRWLIASSTTISTRPYRAFPQWLPISRIVSSWSEDAVGIRHTKDELEVQLSEIVSRLIDWLLYGTSAQKGY